MNPVNLVFRFVLELAALGGFGTCAWTLTQGAWRIPVSLLTTLLIITAWGSFNVPGDPSRSGKALVVVPGAIRLLLELLILFGGAAAFYLSGYPKSSIAMAALIAVHYGFSVQRILWLLRN